MGHRGYSGRYYSCLSFYDHNRIFWRDFTSPVTDGMPFSFLLANVCLQTGGWPIKAMRQALFLTINRYPDAVIIIGNSKAHIGNQNHCCSALFYFTTLPTAPNHSALSINMKRSLEKWRRSENERWTVFKRATLSVLHEPLPMKMFLALPKCHGITTRSILIHVFQRRKSFQPRSDTGFLPRTWLPKSGDRLDGWPPSWIYDSRRRCMLVK